MNDSETKNKAKGRTVYLLGMTALIVCLVVIVFLVFFKHRSVVREQRSRQAGIQAGARVQVAIARRSPKKESLAFTGEARPYATITLYAKVSGYLKEIRVDKGDRVRGGELLARLESPELDSQYLAALADARNKRNFARREVALLKEGIISEQEAEDALTAAKSAEATAASLRTQKEYQVLRAPFTGVVTARFADPGALMQSAATGQTGALPVVTLSRTDRLRIFLYLDQRSAAQVKLHDPAKVSDPARPNLKLPARVSRISGEMDPRTRTMLVELDMPNPKQQLLAGGFVQATLTMASPSYVEVPATAVYTQEEKSFVAVVGSDNRVHFRPVTIADSNGKTIKLSQGVEPTERVALNPGTGLTEGELVQPVAEQPAGGGAQPAKGPHGMQGTPPGKVP